jgi:apolipoprotein N-acyltransferase
LKGYVLKRRSLLRRWRDEALAGLSGGLLLALAFPPFPTRFLAVLALVPLLGYFIIKSDDRDWRTGSCYKRGFVASYLFGIGFFTALLYWVSNLIPASSARMPWLMIPALVLLVLYLSCYTGVFGLVLAVIVRRFGRTALFVAPALWSLLELSRSRGELGFPWGVLSSSLAIHPSAIQGLALYGPFGMSLVLVLVNLLFAFALFGRSGKGRVSALVFAAAIVIVNILWGIGEISRYDRFASLEGRGPRIAVVQPNLDLAIKWDPAYKDTIFTEIETLTARYGEAGAKLVVFPETAAPISIRFSPRYLQRLMCTTMQIETDLLIGFIDHRPTGEGWVTYNAAGLFDERGRLAAQYNKMNLLPFGERIPFSQYLPLLSKLDFGQANFKPGEIPTIFDSGAGTFGVLICFESTFADFSRRYVQDGADMLLNITNDGWFGSEVGPKQHAESAILRAVENRVTVLRAANTGISMIIDPAGRVRHRIELDRSGALEDQLFASAGPTIFTQFGHLPYFIMVLANLAAVGVAISRQRHRP